MILYYEITNKCKYYILSVMKLIFSIDLVKCIKFYSLSEIENRGNELETIRDKRNVSTVENIALIFELTIYVVKYCLT